MTEQNVCLVELNTLINRFIDLAKYNLSSRRKSPKVQKSKSHNRNRALVRQLIGNSHNKSLKKLVTRSRLNDLTPSNEQATIQII